MSDSTAGVSALRSHVHVVRGSPVQFAAILPGGASLPRPQGWGNHCGSKCLAYIASHLPCPRLSQPLRVPARTPASH